MAITPKERRAKMMKARGKTETTGTNPNSPLARRQKDLASKTKTKSITPKERRARDIASRGESSTKYSPMRAQRLRSKGIGTSGDTDTEFKGSVKNLTKKGMARKMENAKPTATSKSPAKSKAGVGTKRLMAGISEFGKAFAKARKAGKKDFTFRDKQYAAITKQEVQKAGASGLGDYLNKLKRKDTKIVKANLNKGGKVTLTGEQKQTAKEKMKARRRAMKGMAKYKVGGSVDEEELQKASDRGAMIEKTKKALDMDTAFKRRNRKMAAEAAEMIERAEYIKKMRGQGINPSEGDIVRRTERGMTRISDPEVSRLEQMMPREMKRDFDTRRYKSGGSVMARGCKMGKKKPTKLY